MWPPWAPRLQWPDRHSAVGKLVAYVQVTASPADGAADPCPGSARLRLLTPRECPQSPLAGVEGCKIPPGALQPHPWVLTWVRLLSCQAAPEWTRMRPAEEAGPQLVPVLMRHPLCGGLSGQHTVPAQKVLASEKGQHTQASRTHHGWAWGVGGVVQEVA